MAKDSFAERQGSPTVDKQKFSSSLIRCLCLGKIHQFSEAIDKWKEKIPFCTVNFIGLTENQWWLEWKIFPGHTTLQLLQKIQKMMGELNCPPEHFTDRIIFMSMYNDIVWGSEKNKSLCIENLAFVSGYEKIQKGQWSFLGPGCGEKSMETHTQTRQGM